MKKIVVANWKQNKTFFEAKEWLQDFEKIAAGFSGSVDVVIAPPFPYLGVVSEFAKKFDWLHVGVQNISAYEDGAHTGEVGIGQVMDFAKYCIVGHSERGESQEEVLKKIDFAISHGLIPIICFVQADALDSLKREDALFLWEDPENISQDGVFKPKPVEDVEAGLKEIREKHDLGENLLYGGSINRQNVSDLGKIPTLNGGVVGGASLDPQHFFEIISAFSQ